MKFIQYNTFEDLQSLKDDWNRLLQKSASHVPFLTFEYQQAWWQTRGGGEWPQSSQLAVVAAFRDDVLVGIAPLFHTENILGKPALMFIGAIEVSDFLDFIAQPEDLPEFINGLLDFLLNEAQIPHWELLDLYNILAGSPSLAILRQQAEERGWTHQQIHLQPSPVISLPKDYDVYLASIDKKQRHEIRRKMRNVENSLVESDLYFTENPETLREDVDSFIKMMAQDPNKRAFLTEPMRQHIHNIAQSAFDLGWLQLAFLTMDGNKAAAYLSFHFDNRLWLYNSAWEWEYRDYSPGWVLLAHLIKWAVDNNLAELDFMRGDEPYKYKFGGVDRHIYRVTLSPSSTI